jgi:hypothetical protein
MNHYYLTVCANGTIVYSGQRNGIKAWETMWNAKDEFLAIQWIRKYQPKLKIAIHESGPMYPGYKKIFCVLHTQGTKGIS